MAAGPLYLNVMQRPHSLSLSQSLNTYPGCNDAHDDDDDDDGHVVPQSQCQDTLLQ